MAGVADSGLPASGHRASESFTRPKPRRPSNSPFTTRGAPDTSIGAMRPSSIGQRMVTDLKGSGCVESVASRAAPSSPVCMAMPCQLLPAAAADCGPTALANSLETASITPFRSLSKVNRKLSRSGGCQAGCSCRAVFGRSAGGTLPGSAARGRMRMSRWGSISGSAGIAAAIRISLAVSRSASAASRMRTMRQTQVSGSKRRLTKNGMRSSRGGEPGFKVSPSTRRRCVDGSSGPSRRPSISSPGGRPMKRRLLRWPTGCARHRAGTGRSGCAQGRSPAARRAAERHRGAGSRTRTQNSRLGSPRPQGRNAYP